MCDILPVIPECQIEENDDINSERNDNDSNAIIEHNTAMYDEGRQAPSGMEFRNVTDANFEHLMISMLEERDKLTGKLRETEEFKSALENDLLKYQRKNAILSQQIEESTNKDQSTMMKELVRLKEQIADREEEIEDLKSERRNTRILLEHLEFLVSRHEKSMRIVVSKRLQQSQQSPTTGTSEIEILEVLRSLFLHHKELDEKIREKLKCSQSRCLNLEDQLDKYNREQANSTKSTSTNSQQDLLPAKLYVTAQVQTTETYNQECDYSKIVALSKECERLREEANNMTERYALLETRAVCTDEKYLNSLKEYNTYQDKIFKLEALLSTKEISLKQVEEKYSIMKDRFDNLSQQIHDSSLISHAFENCPSEERLQIILSELEELQTELATSKQRESLKEEHNRKLTSTVEKFLLESEQKTHAYLEDRMQILQDKNRLMLECEKLRRRLDECNNEKSTLLNQITRFNGQSRSSTYNYPVNQLYWSCRDSQNSLNEVSDRVLETSLSQTNGSVVKHVRHAFESNQATDDLSSNIGSLSYECNDVQSLAVTLQHQLDTINSEMRRVELEKSAAERRVYHLESRIKNASSQDSQQQSLSSSPSDSLYQSNSMLSSSDFRFGYSSPLSESVIKISKHSTHSLPSRSHRNTNDDKYDTLHTSKSYKATTCSTADPRLDNNNNHYVNCRSPVDQALYLDTMNQMDPSEESITSLPKKQKLQITLRGSLGKFFRYSSKQSTTAEQQQINELAQAQQTDQISKSHDVYQLNSEFSRRFNQKQEILDRALHTRLPFAEWDTASVVAWLELWVGMPAWYVAACRANVKSGAIMAGLSDNEIHREIGIANPLHRLKLRLAISEIVAYTSGTLSSSDSFHHLQNITAFKDMNHEWIGNQWLTSLGLRQYRSNFMSNLVDARMLTYLTKKDIRTYIKVVDNGHRKSLSCGIALIQKLNFNKRELEDRRMKSMDTDTDLIVWTNRRLQSWLESSGLHEWTQSMPESGIHGSLIVLDSSFDAKEFAARLSMPQSDTQTRQLLQLKFDKLIKTAAVHRGNQDTSYMVVNEAYAGQPLDGR
ncbi:hypothetical protein GJ496_001816 [Pomphorhynchus laevis]|nr:hypothetical protein GJ496_001816 [Pomphorhynchus laevis]